MGDIKRTGYGQVEPNHLSAQKTGQIYAQLPAITGTGDSAAAISQIEQGQFLKYDYENNRATYDAEVEGEWLLAYAEEKLYDERKQNHKDFVLKASDFSDGYIYPRLLKTNVGDIYTTNTFGANTSDSAEVVGLTLNVGNKLYVQAGTGFLGTTSNQDSPVFKVVKVYTMPDGQPGVKIQRIK